MTDSDLERQIVSALRMLSQIGVPRVAVRDMIAIVDDEVTVGQVIRVLSTMGEAPARLSDDCGNITYAVPEGRAQEDDEPVASVPSPALELKVEVSIRALAERGVSEPSPEQIHETLEDLFKGDVAPQDFIEALDRIARRPPPELYDWQADPSACQDLGAAHRLAPAEESLVEAFGQFLESVSPADFGGTA